MIIFLSKMISSFFPYKGSTQANIAPSLLTFLPKLQSMLCDILMQELFKSLQV